MTDSDIVIVGTGIHPFGRFESTPEELGFVAARQALILRTPAP